MGCLKGKRLSKVCRKSSLTIGFGNTQIIMQALFQMQLNCWKSRKRLSIAFPVRSINMDIAPCITAYGNRKDSVHGQFARKVGEVMMIREYIIKISDEIMEEEIADMPQKLVRCKDCKNWNSLGDSYPERGTCGLWHMLHWGDWFCADGKKRPDL